VAGQALTPDIALAYLDEMSTDIRAALLLDEGEAVAATSVGDTDRARRLRELVLELLSEADAAAGAPVSQVEVSLPAGAVFAVRHHGWSLAVVTGRFALSSLMFYDLRSVLTDLEERAA
jgi:hypothetical protein